MTSKNSAETASTQLGSRDNIDSGTTVRTNYGISLFEEMFFRNEEQFLKGEDVLHVEGKDVTEFPRALLGEIKRHLNNGGRPIDFLCEVWPFEESLTSSFGRESWFCLVDQINRRLPVSRFRVFSRKQMVVWTDVAADGSPRYLLLKPAKGKLSQTTHENRRLSLKRWYVWKPGHPAAVQRDYHFPTIYRVARNVPIRNRELCPSVTTNSVIRDSASHNEQQSSCLDHNHGMENGKLSATESPETSQQYSLDGAGPRHEVTSEVLRNTNSSTVNVLPGFDAAIANLNQSAARQL